MKQPEKVEFTDEKFSPAEVEAMLETAIAWNAGEYQVTDRSANR